MNQIEITREITRIKDRHNCSLKEAVEMICPDCNTNLATEREMFSLDKQFKGHSCKGVK